MSSPKYGRGKFDPHENYISYMEMIVKDPQYEYMPNAVSEGGKINWQVSSGKTTSFNEYYDARFDWWVERADELELPGSGKSNERFTIAARRIHPTGYRACYVCGEDVNVGYFYLNQRLANKLSKLTDERFQRGQPIDEVLEELHSLMPGHEVENLVRRLFKHRSNAFDSYGVTAEAFEHSNHIRSYWLSPGYMGNPPDRLDGFHDYCLYCREENDPGRSKKNLRSYTHDRRAFEWWAEGDWNVADKLYNSAGEGTCQFPGCGKRVRKISPDHVGPLACGFKQIPFFRPSCRSCNSSKNRRMTAEDVSLLMRYEEQAGESAASWQVRALWDEHKTRVEDDYQAQELSTYMRAQQDLFMRALHALYEARHSRFLATLLNPQHALYDVTFVNLDPATLEFDGDPVKEYKNVPLKQSLARRTVRIAFDSLNEYASKGVQDRKVKTLFHDTYGTVVDEIVAMANEMPYDEEDVQWDETMRSKMKAEEREGRLEDLLRNLQPRPSDRELLNRMEECFNTMGNETDLFFA